MQLFDPKNPNEKKKLIAAAVLGVIAIVVLGYVFFGGSSKKPAMNRRLSQFLIQTSPIDDSTRVRASQETGPGSRVSSAENRSHP